MLKYWLYRLKWRLAEKYNIHFKAPLHLDIELTNQCNLACTMCPHGDDNWKPVKGMMDYKTAKEALIQARRMGTVSVKFNFRGEAGLHKQLTELVKYARYVLRYADIQINTNLVAFSERRLKTLCHAGLTRMIVSVDGATKETYEKIRKGAKWSKLISNLQYLNSLANRPTIRIQMTQQGDNEHEVELFKQNFSNWADEVIVKPIRTLDGERKRCPQPSQRLVIGWDGKAYGCCGNWDDNFPIGRFPKQSLKELWNSEPAKLLRQIARDPNCALPCKTCDVGASYK